VKLEVYTNLKAVKLTCILDSFKSIKTIESIYTGGKVVITEDAKYLITTLNEDIIVTELETGKQVHELEGVCSTYTRFYIES
jgi:U3 small nucleolar RNA-associated protein 13